MPVDTHGYAAMIATLILLLTPPQALAELWFLDRK
jgi:hypothetical protein